MTAKELIERLQTLDPNSDVYIYSEKETSLFQVETVYETHDFGPNENGEAEWEDFITIFPATDNNSLFTLTAEEVEDYKKFLEHSTKWNCGATNVDEITLNAKRNEALNRINEWQDGNK